MREIIIRTAVVFLFMISTAFAEQLEIKLSGKSIKLPYWAALKNPHGAVVLVNGDPQGQWSMLLADLAQKLADDGWSAVLLNCNQENSNSWVKEIPEAIILLRQQKNSRIIVLHYGEQSKQTLSVFNKPAKTPIEGLVLLSAYDLAKPDDKKLELSMPLLDLVGQFDYEQVQFQAKAREKMGVSKKYLAKEVPGAHHDYDYSQQFLLSLMRGWMLQLGPLTPPPVLVSYIVAMDPLMPKEIAFDTMADWAAYININETAKFSQKISTS